MKTVIQVPVDRDLLTRLDRQAKADAVSRAALIRRACARYLREAERDDLVARYVEGYRRIPEEIGEEESLAWLGAAEPPDEKWPEAPGQDA